MSKKKVLVTGSGGLVGSAIQTLAKEYPQYEFVGTTHQECDLTIEKEVAALFDDVKPDYVIHTAARVGGIGRNLNSAPLQYYSNILMNAHVIYHANRVKVSKLLAFSSVCAFPAKAKLLYEGLLHDGPPFPAHGAYAYAKRMVDVQIQAYREKDGANYCSVIPGNIFGECDNFDLEDGHVVPSLIHRCHNAKRLNVPFEVWGTGKAKREFLYAEDVGRACIELLGKEVLPPRIIVSSPHEIRIKDMVEKIAAIFDYNNIEWLTDKPDGQLSRPTNKILFNSVLPSFKFTSIDEALEKTIKWFVDNYPAVRR